MNQKILDELQEYIDFHLNSFPLYKASEPESLSNMEIDLLDYIENNRQPTLQEMLFNFIDRIGATDPEIYKKAGMDRKHFSKIRSNPAYRPGKTAIIALALALELDTDEADELLCSAGYSLSGSDRFDLVIQFCLEKKIYKIEDVNQALDCFNLKLLNV
ncbi:hypothetical protein [Metabacillus idriensis]|uniref:hypothetical protein n=1 Tax=Metabacillus idriensis TaxID=324768 RepID=UPI001CD4352A|nr:hypothetical protein [Metabacillus idriensis]